jgi:hypothetical protein
MKIMKLFNILKKHMTAFTNTVSRYPATTIYLVAIVIIRFFAIENINGQNTLYNQLFAALIIGFFISICTRSLIETFSIHLFLRQVLLYSLSVLGALVFYFFIRHENNLDSVGWIRTAILSFGLLVAFLWIPSAPPKKLSFPKSFMSGFKAFFMTLLFSGVLFLGIALVIAAIDNLLFNVDENLYIHFATLVFMFFAPIFYLSLIPNYTLDDEARIEKATQGTAFLETLLSYIIIPLTAIFTLILFIYIIANIRRDFWQENLLEPMLVSYSIVVISVLLLSHRFKNPFASLFQGIFPKLLIPIVLLQIIASIMKISSQGITHGRYFVILYGIFALATGIIFSFFAKKHLGFIAVLFIFSALISTLPPLDAFSVSRRHQIELLEETLTQYNMLNNGQVLPNPSLPDETKSKITQLTSYLHRMNYIKDIAWIPEDFNYYQDFESVFGFNEYDVFPRDPMNKGFQYSNTRDTEDAIAIDGYSHLVTMPISYFSNDDFPVASVSFEVNDLSYSISWEVNENLGQFTLSNSNDESLLILETTNYDSTFYEAENTQAKLKVIPNYMNLYFEHDTLESLNGDVYILIQLK